jgi:hypothetical protein
MRKLRYLVTLLCVLLPLAVRSQQLTKRLTNQDVIDMTGMGLSDDVIVAKIRSASAADCLGVDTSLDGLKSLKTANVSDAVIKVMVSPASAPVALVPGSAAPAAFGDPNLPPPEVGVYWKDGANFVPIEGQPTSHTKAGGKMGSLLTDGMRSLHWDATLEGPSSKNRVKDHKPLFYFYVPDGASASDFSLIRLNKKEHRREFEIGSFGGMNGGKSGLKKDKELSFQFEHVAIRTFRITLDEELKSGEYAFFLSTGQELQGGGGGRGTKGSGGSVSGRIYDFGVPE